MNKRDQQKTALSAMSMIGRGSRMLERIWSHDRQNRLVGMHWNLDMSSTAYVYDSSGRMIMRTAHNGRKEKYYYDGINRLLVREKPNSSCERTKEVYFLKQAAIGQVIARREYTYSSAPGHCTQGMQYQDKAYQYDPVGNVLIELQGNGTMPQMIEMEAFGKPRSGGVAGPRLTTKHYDVTLGLYYFGARWYDPAVGQFISPTIFGPLREHTYNFVEGSPPNLVDPDGRFPLQDSINSIGNCINCLRHLEHQKKNAEQAILSHPEKANDLRCALEQQVADCAEKCGSAGAALMQDVYENMANGSRGGMSPGNKCCSASGGFPVSPSGPGPQISPNSPARDPIKPPIGLP